MKKVMFVGGLVLIVFVAVRRTSLTRFGELFWELRDLVMTSCSLGLGSVRSGS